MLDQSVQYGKGDRNKAAKYYQTAVDMDAVMPHTECMAIIYVPNHATGKYKESCIDEYHDDFMEKVRNNLAILKGQTSPMNVVDHTHLFQNQINFNKGQTLKDQERLILAHQCSLELGCHSCQKIPPAVDRLKRSVADVTWCDIARQNVKHRIGKRDNIDCDAESEVLWSSGILSRYKA